MVSDYDDPDNLGPIGCFIIVILLLLSAWAFHNFRIY